MVTCPQVAESEDYIDDLWFLLHHSDDKDRLVIGLTCYLDDSGSDDGSQMVTCAGPVMSRIQLKTFCARWNKMLAAYKVEPPLHISDFIGMGKYAIWYPEFKRALFREVSSLINLYKLYSVSIAVSQTDFKNELDEDVRKKLIGPYAFAFFAIVLANWTVSEKQRSGPFKVSYLIDTGFGHQQQLVDAHRLVQGLERQRGEFLYTGALAFDADDGIPALQAADAIAWASRKLEQLGTLPEGFEPLAEALSEDFILPHKTIHIPPNGIKMLANPINKWISLSGDIPRLEDVIVQRPLS